MRVALRTVGATNVTLGCHERDMGRGRTQARKGRGDGPREGVGWTPEGRGWGGETPPLLENPSRGKPLSARTRYGVVVLWARRGTPLRDGGRVNPLRRKVPCGAAGRCPR